MSLTNFPNGITSFGVPVLGGEGLMTQGKSFFVKPISGSDGNTGEDVNRPLKTLAKALDLATSNQNDTIYMFAEHGVTGASTTDYLTVNAAATAGIDWNKNLVHLVGVGTGSMLDSRSRIATASVLTVPLFIVSGNGCKFENISWFFGYAGTTTTGIGALKITGKYNSFYNCTISGIGHDDMDVTDAYSLSLSTAANENYFNHCYIGLDTIARGTAQNYEIVMVDSGATRNIFEDCIIASYSESANHRFINVADRGIDRFVMFKNCEFINFGTAMTEALSVATNTGGPSGSVLVQNCGLYNAALWETSSGASTRVLMVGVAKLATQTGMIGFATA